MHKKFIIKSTIFIIIFCVLTTLLGQFFQNGKNTTMDGFYYEEENSLDVLFFGSSQVYCTVAPNVIWEKTGVTNYNLAQPEQPLWLTYHYIKEALKYQKPKVVFVDVLTVNIEDEYMPTANSNTNLNPLKLSLNKLEAIQASVQKQERPYFLFKLLSNKSNWKNLNKSNFVDNFEHTRNINKGFLEFYESNPYEATDGYKTKEIGTIPYKSNEYLMKIIDLCKKENLELVLFKAPYVVTKEHQKKFNKVAQIASENNIDFIDFNQMYDRLDLDFNTDMLDSYHLNLVGARKVSEYIAKYIDKNYDLENRQNDPKYSQWNIDSLNWSRKEAAFKLSQEKDIKGYFEILDKDSNYMAIMSYNDENETYYRIIEGENVVDEQYGDKNLSFNKNINGVNLNISFINGNSSIKINDEELSKGTNGLNIVVYDKVLKSVVDKSNIDFSRKIKFNR